MHYYLFTVISKCTDYYTAFSFNPLFLMFLIEESRECYLWTVPSRSAASVRTV